MQTSEHADHQGNVTSSRASRLWPHVFGLRLPVIITIIVLGALDRLVLFLRLLIKS